MIKKKYFHNNSIHNTFSLIGIMVMRDEWELNELVTASALPKTTVHRILLNLQELGYIEQDRKSNRYVPTTKMFEQGCAIVNKKNILRIARSSMETISSQLGETVCLAVRDGIEMILLDKIDSYHHTFRDNTQLGGRFATYCSASGKAILAQLDDIEIINLFSNQTFVKHTINTVSNTEELISHLAATRSRGYSKETEEYTLGLRCIGAPIFNHRAEVIAGLSIAAPLARLTDKSVIENADILIRGAELVSKKMGYIPPTKI